MSCEPEIILPWILSAKNRSQNRDGFTPTQLVFGHNVNTKPVLPYKFPVLQTTKSSDI